MWFINQHKKSSQKLIIKQLTFWKKNFSTNKKNDRYSRQKFNANNREYPEFSQLLKAFYKKSHPDIVRSLNPILAEENDVSFQELNEILSTIKNQDQYPPQMSKTIIFNVKNDQNDFKKVGLMIKTAGGDCRRSLSISFQTFFESVGLGTSRFVWGKDYFPSSFDK
jgi:hypothetical protein